MEPVTVAFAVLAGVVTFVIAAVAVGREAHRLDAVSPRAVYRLDEAVDFVSDRLPEESQARLTPEEVEQLLVFHMQWLHSKGLQPDNVTDRRQDIDETVVINEDALTAYLLGEAERNDIDLLADVDAYNVVEAHLAYFEVICAVGPQAPLDDVLD
ncbi:MAG: hypothetical protein ACR2O6_15825 [Ilumatobacteraceae bacterium]